MQLCASPLMYMPNFTDALVVKWEQISAVSFQDIVERLLKQWSVIAVALMLMGVEWNVQQSHIRAKYRCPHTTSGCQHSFCHRMYFIFNFRLNDVQISAFLCGDLKYWASVLTLEDLLHCEWFVLQTGANTSLQAEAQIPAVLLQMHTHTLTWESRKAGKHTLNAADFGIMSFSAQVKYDLWPVSVNWVCVGPGLFLCSLPLALLIPPLLRTTTPIFRVFALLRILRASQWTQSHSDVPLIDKTWSPSLMEPSWAATPEWNTLWTWEEDIQRQMKRLSIMHLQCRYFSQEKRVFPHSDWLVLVYTSCHTEAQSHSHLLMENHHLHIIVVLQIGKEETKKLMTFFTFWNWEQKRCKREGGEYVPNWIWTLDCTAVRWRVTLVTKITSGGAFFWNNWKKEVNTIRFRCCCFEFEKHTVFDHALRNVCIRFCIFCGTFWFIFGVGQQWTTTSKL